MDMEFRDICDKALYEQNHSFQAQQRLESRIHGLLKASEKI